MTVAPRKFLCLPLLHIPLNTSPIMDSIDCDRSSLPENDPELEREFQEWAQWLLDVYLWRLEQERNAGGNTQVDSDLPSPTM